MRLKPALAGLFFVCAAGGGVLCSPQALGAPAGAPPPATSPSAVGQSFLSAIYGILNSLDATAESIAGDVLDVVYGSGGTPDAESLFTVALAIAIAWFGILALVSTGAEFAALAGKALMGALLLGITVLLLSNYVQITTWINDGFTQMAYVFAGLTGSPGGGIGSVRPSGFAGVISAGLSTIIHLIVTTANQFPAPSTDCGITSLGSCVTDATKYVTLSLVVIAQVLMLAVLLLIYVGMAFLAELMFAIGIVFGPLMAVLSLLPPLRSFLFSWLRYLIAAGFFKLCLAALLGIGGAVFAYAGHFVGVLGSGTVSGISWGQIALFMEVTAFMLVLIGALGLSMVFASNMANALLAGSVASPGGRFMPRMGGKASDAGKKLGGSGTPRTTRGSAGVGRSPSHAGASLSMPPSGAKYASTVAGEGSRAGPSARPVGGDKR